MSQWVETVTPLQCPVTHPFLLFPIHSDWQFYPFLRPPLLSVCYQLQNFYLSIPSLERLLSGESDKTKFWISLQVPHTCVSTTKFTTFPINLPPLLCWSEYLGQISPIPGHHNPSASCPFPCYMLSSHPQHHIHGSGHHHTDYCNSLLNGLLPDSPHQAAWLPY